MPPASACRAGLDLVGPGLGRHRKAEPGAAVEVALGDAARQVPDPADVGGALGDADRAARVEQVEAVRRLQHLLVGRQGERLVHQRLGLALVSGEGDEQELDVARLEVVGALLDLVLVIDVGVAEAVGPLQLVDVVDALHVHRQPLEAVGDLAGDRPALDAADLLEVGELGHLHAVQPDLPAEAPGAERRVLPVVLDEADVVGLQVEAELLERAEVEVEDVGRSGLEHHLVLVVVLQPVRVLAVAAVLGPPARLHVGRLPRLGAEGAQEGRGVAGAGADLHVVGLEQRAALLRPVGLQAKDDVLEREHRAWVSAGRPDVGELCDEAGF
jgi:hypothetical protein